MKSARLAFAIATAMLAVPAVGQSSPNFLEGDYWSRQSLSLDQEKVRGLLENGKVEAALARLAPLAERGDAWAQAVLGAELHKRGDARALYWIEAAATQGHAPSALFMGVAYATGQGFDRDPAIAKGWLLLAARRGDRVVIRDAHRMMRQLDKIS